MPRQLVLLTDPSGTFFPPRMIADLSLLATMPRGTLQAVAESLGRESGFLTPARVEELVKSIISDTNEASAVANAVVGIQQRQVARTLDDLRAWRESNPKHAERLPPDNLARLQENLSALIRDYPGLDLYRKASHLAGLTGNKVDSVDLLCDLRPIFDKERERVEGFLPLLTLRIGFHKQDESEETIEFVLSGGLLDELTEKLNKAAQKLTVLENLISDAVPVEWVQPE